MNKPRYAFLQPGRYARGWHIVLFSCELQLGEVKQLHYFDQDIVAYRGESGRVAILDAHCPHLGANLASGEGRVSGDTIACPFHGWVFDPDGRLLRSGNRNGRFLQYTYDGEGLLSGVLDQNTNQVLWVTHTDLKLTEVRDEAVGGRRATASARVSAATVNRSAR